MSGIVGILLAAGQSRRFGGDKRFHRLADGTPMALASARHLAAVCRRCIVVIRPDDTLLADWLTAEGIETLVCSRDGQGMGDSLRDGVAASAEASGWLVALADMPFIQPASYHAVRLALEAGAAIARPFYQERAGHPVGFAASLRQPLLDLAGEMGGKAIIEARPAALIACPVDDPGVLVDLDRPPAGSVA